MRAIRLANATATSMRGLRASIRASQGSSCEDGVDEQRATDDRHDSDSVRRVDRGGSGVHFRP